MVVDGLNPSRYRPVWNRGLGTVLLGTSLPYPTSADHVLRTQAQARARARAEPGTHAEDRAHAGYGLRAGRGEHRVGGSAAVFAGARHPRRDQARHHRRRERGAAPGRHAPEFAPLARARRLVVVVTAPRVRVDQPLARRVDVDPGSVVAEVGP